MAHECLICLLPLVHYWTPHTPCGCRPAIHRDCWERWVAHNGAPVCIICRKRWNPPIMVVIVEEENRIVPIVQLLLLIGSIFFFVHLVELLRR